MCRYFLVLFKGKSFQYEEIIILSRGEVELEVLKAFIFKLETLADLSQGQDTLLAEDITN